MPPFLAYFCLHIIPHTTAQQPFLFDPPPTFYLGAMYELRAYSHVPDTNASGLSTLYVGLDTAVKQNTLHKI